MSAADLKDAAALGLTQEDFPQPECEVFPDCWMALSVFQAMATQWRILAGVGGVMHLGLEYPALEVVLRRRVPAAQRQSVWQDVMVMESAALAELNKEQ